VEDPAAPAPENYQFLFIVDSNAIFADQKISFSVGQDSGAFWMFANDFIPACSGDEEKQKDDDRRLLGF
jgi:hypothetical protein